MLKLLLIIAITVYVLSKVGRFFFRMGMSSSQNRQTYRPRDGNVNVDEKPDKQKSHVKGGEYIDYEEVK
ncbi:MAG: DUF4834 domain-containing protein [Cyclobacteriaceae bacterium]|nr:DUF4834 domain-containing protein [Cyclobacteriaceae bacterium]